MRLCFQLCYNNGVMKVKITSFFVLFLCLISILAIPSQTIGDFGLNQTPLRENGEIIVKYKSAKKIQTVKIAPGDNLDDILNIYRNKSEVEYAEPNYKYQASIIPSDTYYGSQWYLQKIRAIDTWDEVRESPGIIIAVVDSGVQINHPDLASNIWVNKKEKPGNGIDDDKNGFIDDINGWDFINNVADPAPKFKEGYTEAGILHGTIIAGIAAASGNNAAGIAGITWKAQIMPLKVLDDKGEGNTTKVVKAIDYAVANGADIINLSFVGFGYSKSLDDAIKRAYDAGVIVVAAAGNEQADGEGYLLDETPMYPVCNDGNGENRVVGVAATDTMDQKAPFSSYGSKCIDIAAPGLSAFSTVVYSPNNKIGEQAFDKYYDGYWSGTSVAVPIVSGAIALIEAANPRLNRNQVLKALYEYSDNISQLNAKYDNKLGAGRVNIKTSVNYVRNIIESKSEMIVTAPYSNHVSTIRITDKDGKINKEFNAYGNKFLGGASLASCDINNDGIQEIITGAGNGGSPHVRITNSSGELLEQFFAYPQNYRAGINLVCADVNNDKKNEIITAPNNGLAQIKVFDQKGKLLNSFTAYAKTFLGGANVAAGDVDGDGRAEIVTGTGNSGGPQVRIFNASGAVEGQFFAYTQSFRGGVRVATGDINGKTRGNRLEIITAPGKGGGPHVKAFDNKGNVIAQFFAYNQSFRGGVNIASGDIDKDGLDEIVTAAGPGGAPHVRVFDANNSIIGSYYAYEGNFTGGVNIAIIKY